MKKIGPYLIFIAAMLWATDAPFRVHLTKELSSNFIVLGEHFVDILFVLPVLVMGFGDLKKLNFKDWLAVLFIAVGGSALASVAFTQAFHYVNPSVAILLQKLQPLITIGLAATILKENLNSKFWLWAIVALFGAYLISFNGLRPQLFPGDTLNPNLKGVGLALIAAFFWGGSTVMGKLVLEKVNFKIMTSLRFVLAFVFLLILNISQHTIPKFSTLTKTDWSFIAIIAITSGVVSLFIYYRGLAYTKASVATLAELGFPMAAVFVNWIFLPQYGYSTATVAYLISKHAYMQVLPFIWGLFVFYKIQTLGMVVLLFAIFRLASYNKQQENLDPKPLLLNQTT